MFSPYTQHVEVARKLTVLISCFFEDLQIHRDVYRVACKIEYHAHPRAKELCLGIMTAYLSIRLYCNSKLKIITLPCISSGYWLGLWNLAVDELGTIYRDTGAKTTFISITFWAMTVYLVSS